MNATDVLVMSVASYFVNMYFLGCLPCHHEISIFCKGSPANARLQYALRRMLTMDQSHPDQRLPSGKPLPKGVDNNRCRQCLASVSSRLPVRQQTGTSEKAGKETADGERFSDFDQESILCAAWSERRESTMPNATKR